MSNFDPIVFLSFEHLSTEEQDALRPYLYEDMAKFLMNKFTESLTDTAQAELEKNLVNMTGPKDVFEFIKLHSPNFDQKKPILLEEYRKSFKLENLTPYI